VRQTGHCEHNKSMPAAERLQQKIVQIQDQLIEQVPQIAIAVVVLVITYAVGLVLGKGVGAWARRFHADRSLQVLFERGTRWVVVLVGIALALTVAVPGFTLANVVTGLGFGGVIVGFAFREMFENYLAGVYFLMARPFTIGSWIKVDKVSGTVENITTRAVNVRTFERELEILPCSYLFKNRFTVVDNQAIRRYDQPVIVSLDSDIEVATRVIEEVVSDLPGVVGDPAPFVIAESFGDTGIQLRLYYFLDTSQEGIFAGRHRVTKAIHDVLTREGVSISTTLAKLAISPDVHVKAAPKPSGEPEI